MHDYSACIIRHRGGYDRKKLVNISIMRIGMAAAVLIGGLDQKRTNYEEIRKDYRI